MFRKALAGLFVAALGACAGTPASLQTNIATAEADVQAATLAICAVVPTASSIAALIKANDPTLATVNAIATVICKAIAGLPVAVATPVAGRYRGSLYGATRPAPVTVDGVKILFQ